jgi:hypothetical protein
MDTGHHARSGKQEWNVLGIPVCAAMVTLPVRFAARE